MERKKVVVIEDETDIARLIEYNLSIENLDVACFSSGKDGLEAVINTVPDLVVIDLMLPDLDGISICHQLKTNPGTSEIPVIMVTAKGEDTDIVAGLEAGADDYITKPFSPKVLVARVKAVLRRTAKSTPIESDDFIKIHELQIHPGRHEVHVHDDKIDLTRSEFLILQFLAGRPGWVFTRAQIVQAIRGENYAVTDRSIDFQMTGLRKKLGVASKYIETVRGVGYRFGE